MTTAPAFGKTMPQNLWLPYDESLFICDDKNHHTRIA
jgi:hypothetical protein